MRESIKDAKKLAASGPKSRAQDLLAVVVQDPSQTRRLLRDWLATWRAPMLATQAGRARTPDLS
jgi:hypothetical protein